MAAAAGMQDTGMPQGTALGTRHGDSRMSRAATYGFSTEDRPLVGTSRTYGGREAEMRQDSKIGKVWLMSRGPRLCAAVLHIPTVLTHSLLAPCTNAQLSPGPKYLPEYSRRVGFPSTEVLGSTHNAPTYQFGLVRVTLDKRVSPGPCNYNKASTPAVGPQKIDSTRVSKPLWGMGGCTREVRQGQHLAKYHSSNLSSRAVLGDPLPDAEPAPLAADAASRDNLTRALAVAMTAKKAEADPELAAALATLHSRVGTLRAQEAKA